MCESSAVLLIVDGQRRMVAYRLCEQLGGSPFAVIILHSQPHELSLMFHRMASIALVTSSPELVVRKVAELADGLTSTARSLVRRVKSTQQLRCRLLSSGSSAVQTDTRILSLLKRTDASKFRI